MNEREKDFTSSFSPAEGNDFLLALHTRKIISKLFIYVWKKAIGHPVTCNSDCSKCIQVPHCPVLSASLDCCGKVRNSGKPLQSTK